MCQTDVEILMIRCEEGRDYWPVTRMHYHTVTLIPVKGRVRVDIDCSLLCLAVAYPELVSGGGGGGSKTCKFKWLVNVGASIV